MIVVWNRLSGKVPFFLLPLFPFEDWRWALLALSCKDILSLFDTKQLGVCQETTERWHTDPNHPNIELDIGPSTTRQGIVSRISGACTSGQGLHTEA
jgi:hypothetical protein